MPYQVMFAKLSFQPTKPGEPTVPDGPEETVLRGGLVPDYVPTYIVSALLNSGMIVPVAEPDPRVVPATQIPEQVRTPDQPAVLPSDPNGTPPVIADLPPVTTTDVPADPFPSGPSVDTPDTEPLPPLPRPADNKEAWETYAVRPQIGMTLGEAEAMNKTDLMNEVKRRHAAATA